MRYAVGKGCFITVAGGNEFEDTVPPFGTNPTSIVAEIASRIPGAVSVAAVDRAKAHAYYSSTGSYIELAAPGGSERGFGSNGFVRQQTFDFNFTDTFLLPPSQYRRAAVRRVRLHRLHRHVDGGAARRGRRGDADAAGRSPTRPPSRSCSRRPRSISARQAATTRSGSGWSTRARRCADWGWRSEVASSCLAGSVSLVAAPAAAQDPPALSIRPFVMATEQSFAADRHVRRGVRQDLLSVLRRRRPGRDPRPLLRRAQRVALPRRPASARFSAAGSRSSSAFR